MPVAVLIPTWPQDGTVVVAPPPPAPQGGGRVVRKREPWNLALLRLEQQMEEFEQRPLAERAVIAPRRRPQPPADDEEEELLLAYMMSL